MQEEDDTEDFDDYGTFTINENQVTDEASDSHIEELNKDTPGNRQRTTAHQKHLRRQRQDHFKNPPKTSKCHHQHQDQSENWVTFQQMSPAKTDQIHKAEKVQG